MAAYVAACLLLAVWLQLCSAQTAYIVPDMQADNPSNHSYMRLGAIITNRVMLDDYDTIVLTKDYRIIVSATARLRLETCSWGWSHVTCHSVALVWQLVRLLPNEVNVC